MKLTVNETKIEPNAARPRRFSGGGTPFDFSLEIGTRSGR